MFTAKTGTWVNINGTRLYLSEVTTHDIKGVAIDNTSHAPLTKEINIKLSDVRDISRSRRPREVKKDPASYVAFGHIDWDTTKHKITEIRIIQDNRLHVMK